MRKLRSVAVLAAVGATIAVLAPAAMAGGTTTTLYLDNWAGGPPVPTSGSFTAKGGVLCASGTWSTVGSVTTGVLTLTCSNGTITFAEGVGSRHGKPTGTESVTNGTGAYLNASGQLDFVRDTAALTGVWSGTLSL